MFEFIETKRHTVESVYGRPEAEILARIDARYEAVEFRFPADRERCLSADKCQVYESWGLALGPRLILRRKTVKRRVLTETGEVRQANKGEWSGDHKGISLWSERESTRGEYPIYRETFVEVEA